MYYSTDYESPIGPMVLVSDGQNIVGLWMEGQKYFGATVKGEISLKADLPVLEAAKGWLDRYFAGEKPEIFELPLAPVGGEFRQAVWKLLCEIPYGEVTTYGAIAKKIAKIQSKKTMSAQAVGGAVGHNPISVIIPCHRVVGTGGNLTGYAGGMEKKTRLLQLEGVDITRLFVPTKGTAL